MRFRLEDDDEELDDVTVADFLALFLSTESSKNLTECFLVE
jgi:hypothetical protein